jgi:hypothetical protein
MAEQSIYDKLASYKNANVNSYVRRLLEARKFDTRMNLCDLILGELGLCGVDIEEIEDEVKDLAID